MASPNYSLSFEKCNNNQDIVPLLRSEGKEYWLGSKYNPMREAQKNLESIAESSLFLMIGYGDGLLLRLLAEKYLHASFLIFDFFDEMENWINKSILKFFGSQTKDSRIISHTICHKIEDIEDLIKKNYSPMFYASVRIVASPAFSNYRKFLSFDPILICSQTVEGLANDFVTQSIFGKIWHRNIIHNVAGLFSSNDLKINYQHVFNKFAKKDCLILGAGPGLEVYKHEILKLHSQGYLIACADASLNWVLSCLQTYPDLVLTIDPQDYTLYHSGFVAPNSTKLNYLADLGSHKQLFSRHAALPINCGHPLAHFLTDKLNIPLLINNGGNVGHALCTFMLQLGIKSLRSFGLDFAYYNGLPYCKNTEWFSTALQKQKRTKPFEQLGIVVKSDWQANSDEIKTFTNFSSQKFLAYHAAFKAIFYKSGLQYNSTVEGNNFASQISEPFKQESISQKQIGLPSQEFSILRATLKTMEAFLQENSDNSLHSFMKSKNLEELTIVSGHLPLIAHYFSKAIRAGYNPTDSITMATEQGFSYSRRLIKHLSMT